MLVRDVIQNSYTYRCPREAQSLFPKKVPQKTAPHVGVLSAVRVSSHNLGKSPQPPPSLHLLSRVIPTTYTLRLAGEETEDLRLMEVVKSGRVDFTPLLTHLVPNRWRTSPLSTGEGFLVSFLNGKSFPIRFIQYQSRILNLREVAHELAQKLASGPILLTNSWILQRHGRCTKRQRRQGRDPEEVMKIECILCPTDLSPDSDEALRYAIALARSYNAELILLHCDPIDDGLATPAAHDEAAQTIREALEKHYGSADLEGLDWRTLIVNSDDAGAAIAREAAQYGVDLIVMRSRRRPHRAALMGSTAESVSRNAPCPVLVMHTDERDWVRGSETGIELKRVLVAYDFSDYSELALKYALSFAQEYQSELHLLHVLPPFTANESEISCYPLGRESTYHKAAHRLQKAVPPEAHLWCNIKHAVSEGQPYREVLGYAEKNKIDLICLGAHGAGFGMRALFGSNVDRVIRQAPCPVLVTRPLKPAMSCLRHADHQMELATV